MNDNFFMPGVPDGWTITLHFPGDWMIDPEYLLTLRENEGREFAVSFGISRQEQIENEFANQLWRERYKSALSDVFRWANIPMVDYP